MSHVTWREASPPVEVTARILANYLTSTGELRFASDHYRFPPTSTGSV